MLLSGELQQTTAGQFRPVVTEERGTRPAPLVFDFTLISDLVSTFRW
jgi:hypothetical protein